MPPVIRCAFGVLAQAADHSTRGALEKLRRRQAVPTRIQALCPFELEYLTHFADRSVRALLEPNGSIAADQNNR